MIAVKEERQTNNIEIGCIKNIHPIVFCKGYKHGQTL